MILCLNKVNIYRLCYVLNWKKWNFVSFFEWKKNIEQKPFVKISCSFFISHSIFEVAIFLWPYMTRVSKKIATLKIEWLIKKLQLILTNLFLYTNKPQKDPQNCQKYKKSIFSALGVDRDLGFSQGPQTQFFLSFCILPIPLIPLKFLRNTPKSLRNLQNLRKSNFWALGLDRDQRTSIP